MEIRYLIVQYATMLEEVCSLCLCELLLINKESSISFGYGSQSLSFNSKINLIADLTKTSSDLKGKFVLFSEIRNKFAHVFEVSSFHSFCSLGKEWEKKAKRLLNFYEIEDIPNEEFRFCIAYILLYKELEEYMLQLSNDSAHDRGYKEGKLHSLEKFRDVVSKEFLNIPERLEIIKKYFEELE